MTHNAAVYIMTFSLCKNYGNLNRNFNGSCVVFDVEKYG